MRRLRELGRDSIVYGLGGILARGVGFLLLPVYTRIFSPADFGTIEMLAVLNGFLAAFIVLGFDSAQSFYFFQVRDEGKLRQSEIVSAILQWRLTVGLLLVVLSVGASPFLDSFFFQSELGLSYFLIAFGGVFFAQTVQQAIEIFRLLRRPYAYVSIELSRSLIMAGIVVCSAVWLEMGTLSYFIGIASTNIILAIVGCWCIRDYLRFDRFFFSWWPRLLRFGLPLVPAAFAMYLMNSTDRWFLQRFSGSEEVGIYAIGARFAVTLGLAVETFRKAWWPIAMDALHSDDGPSLFRQISQLYMGLGMAGVVYLGFLAPWIIETFTAPAYHEAYTLLGILGFQPVFYGFYLVASVGIWKKEKTKFAAGLTILGALGNIVLNFILVPRFGGIGAAIATNISYFLWCAGSMLIGERLWRVGFPWGRIGLQVGSTVLIAGFIQYGYRVEWSIILIGIVAHLGAVVLILTSVDKVLIRQLMRKAKK